MCSWHGWLKDDGGGVVRGGILVNANLSRRRHGCKGGEEMIRAISDFNRGVTRP